MKEMNIKIIHVLLWNWRWAFLYALQEWAISVAKALKALLESNTYTERNTLRSISSSVRRHCVSHKIRRKLSPWWAGRWLWVRLTPSACCVAWRCRFSLSRTLPTDWVSRWHCQAYTLCGQVCFGIPPGTWLPGKESTLCNKIFISTF